ncbi:MAG: hypothetical protein ACP5NX_01610 [Candidatus Bilamarchaeaceae archaeon]
MMDRKNTGLAMAAIGLLMLAAYVSGCLFDFGPKAPAFAAIGLVCVAVGMKMAKPSEPRGRI